MSRPRGTLHALASLVGATTVLVVVAALGTFGIGTAFLEAREGVPSVERAAPAARPIADHDGTTRGLLLHLQMPAAVPRDGSRVLGVALSGGGSATRGDVGREYVEVAITSDDPRIGVIPSLALVTRDQLPRTRFAVAARPDLACGETLEGKLRVTVRGLSPSATPVHAHAPLPRLDCDSTPPDAPASVHVTDPVCGPDHAEQAQRLLDGKWLHPHRCAPARWRDGRWQEPPARSAPRTRSNRAPSRDAETTSAGEDLDSQTEADDESTQDEDDVASGVDETPAVPDPERDERTDGHEHESDGATGDAENDADAGDEAVAGREAEAGDEAASDDEATTPDAGPGRAYDDGLAVDVAE